MEVGNRSFKLSCESGDLQEDHGVYQRGSSKASKRSSNEKATPEELDGAGSWVEMGENM